jgi:O-antigen/teichoic acid export membrane protein
LRGGALTGLGQLALAFAAAGAGALLANRFGRDAETDGILAAYAVYGLLVLAAHSLRLILVPDLTRAVAAGRLAGEVRAYAAAFALVGVPACVLVAALSHPLGELVTSTLPQRAADVAGDSLVIMVPAAFLQLYAALAASALAALDSYGVAAAAFGGGGVAGLVVFAALSGPVGITAMAWGILGGSTVAAVVPLAALHRRGALSGPGAAERAAGRRLWRALEGSAVPLALQGAYLVELRLAAKTGVGSVTSLTYAFLAASTLVSATGYALGVVSAAPLTRRGVDPVEAGRHVVHAAWVSLSFVGAAAGVCALVGTPIVRALLGEEYGGDVGRELGLLVVYLSPWMVAWIAFAVTYPLVFVTARRGSILPIAAAGLAASVAFGLPLRAGWGLPGLVVALGLSTLVIAGCLLAAVGRSTLAIGMVGLARVALALGAASALAFGPIALGVSDALAAAIGVVVYAALVFALRAYGLGDAWAYVRGLH